MGYIREIYETHMGRMVKEYHSGRKPSPGPRRKRQRPTPEEMEKANQKKKERKAQLLLMANFTEHDYYATLTYRKEERPENMEQCRRQFRRFIERVRTAYRRAGYELKWIRNIEQGSRGAWHVHLIVNRVPGGDVILREAWEYGGVHIDLMYTEGGFRKLAKYITKTSREEGGTLKESSYSTSRNLIRPQPKRKEMSGRTFREKKIHVPKGYVLDKESVYEGTNIFTGYPYRYYTLLRIGKVKLRD